MELIFMFSLTVFCNLYSNIHLLLFSLYDYLLRYVCINDDLISHTCLSCVVQTIET